MINDRARFADTESTASPLRLPAALIYCWPRPPLTWSELIASEEARALLATEGIVEARPGVLAILPTAGKPDIFDSAARGARQLLRAARGNARCLVVPAICVPRQDGTVRWDDPLAEDLGERPPVLLWNAPHCSGRATQLLEGRFHEIPRGVYEAPSGQRIPLIRLASRAPCRIRARNLRRSARAIKGVPREA